jgi:purine-nucleoside/S-methyl-5'-thioadenosine phosphorylase / adenosine deaminase
MNIVWMIFQMSSRMSIETVSSDSNFKIIKPDWPAAKNIHACCTTRISGVSQGAYAGLNLALHVEDEASRVQVNRQQLFRQLKLPREPHWLNQTHGIQVVDATKNQNAISIGDASYSFQAKHICTVMTADCLPVLICNRNGNKVAAVHAGWRGLADGVIEASVASLNEKPDDLLVWLGPAIGPQAFEVGEEVCDIFIKKQPQCISAFEQNRAGHFLLDIYHLARLRLQQLGISAVYGGEYCTFTDVNHFYSYRRDGTTGRQASLIWFD